MSLADICITVVTSGKTKRLSTPQGFTPATRSPPTQDDQRFPRLKLAVEALMASVKPMGDIVGFTEAFFFFFGILGLQSTSIPFLADSEVMRGVIDQLFQQEMRGHLSEACLNSELYGYRVVPGQPLM
ncbi:voltage-dependent T-type calcium channel subunit alpha-1I-like [Odontesthes bonariensis]